MRPFDSAQGEVWGAQGEVWCAQGGRQDEIAAVTRNARPRNDNQRGIVETSPFDCAQDDPYGAGI